MLPLLDERGVVVVVVAAAQTVEVVRAARPPASPFARIADALATRNTRQRPARSTRWDLASLTIWRQDGPRHLGAGFTPHRQ